MKELYCWTFAMIIIFCICSTILKFDTAGDVHSYECTVVAKQIYQGGYKSAGHNKMAFRMLDGSEWETDVTLGTYAKYNVGDKIYMDRTNMEVNPEKYGNNVLGCFVEFFMLVSGVFGVLLGFVTLIFTEWAPIFKKVFRHE
jgi:hypothetical protein